MARGLSPVMRPHKRAGPASFGLSKTPARPIRNCTSGTADIVSAIVCERFYKNIALWGAGGASIRRTRGNGNPKNQYLGNSLWIIGMLVLVPFLRALAVAPREGGAARWSTT